MSDKEKYLKTVLNLVFECVLCFDDCEREKMDMPYFVKILLTGDGKIESVYGKTIVTPEPRNIAHAILIEKALCCGAQKFINGQKTRTIHARAQQDVVCVTFLNNGDFWRCSSIEITSMPQSKELALN
jgi:hypothetical protein